MNGIRGTALAGAKPFTPVLRARMIPVFTPTRRYNRREGVPR
jgi:hypothetical protein